MLTNTLDGSDSGPDMETLDQGILTGLIGRHLRITHNAVFRLAEQRLHELGITPQQFALLVLVERNPGSRQSLIAKARGLDKSTLVPMIDRLEREGLLERRPMAGDRRIKTIWLTEKGADLLQQAIPAIAATDESLGASLTAEERTELVRLLKKLRQDVSEE
ncbi:MarR family winged helix-turn-helix transcriptional regulator [Mesorhizobium xinjiangense]|uniref:MarR family winged helix-turn-helix transcriptional regulator n=1 Tax=Mesorhizobium xinjiangense TaxID=2678685 RepID=UPI0018DD0E3E|nr:MarR family transcriptional regulator [Mesorhizobium xinjiangense]